MSEHQQKFLVFKLTVAYDGTRFHGFQRQIDNCALMQRWNDKNRSAHRPPKRPHHHAHTGQRKHCSLTIQETLEMAVLDACQDAKQSVTVDDLCLRFAGRTDKGVHATGQVVTITAPLLRKERDGAPGHLRKSINSRLPVDVSVERIECLGACDPDNVVLDPRRDVINKTYSYAIKFRRKLRGRRENENNGTDCHRHAFDPPCLWTCPWPLDDSKLPDLCHRLSGTHDYLNFWHKEERKKFDADDGESSSVMTVQCQWQLEKEQKNAEGDVVVVGRFLFSAKGFRRSMIRNLVGYCVDVCRGLEEVAKMDLERQVLRKQSCVSDNSSTAPQIHSAPASGLCLQSVTY